MVKAYSYKPLESDHSTRLIKLYSDPNDGSPLSCDLLEVDLHLTLPEYEAISYTWQGQLPSRKIYCAGAPLLISENSFAALHHFRPTGEGSHRLLWMDSVSINQDPEQIEERSGQVALMRDVYASARQVLVWLVPNPISEAVHTRNLDVCAWLHEAANTAVMPAGDEQINRYLELIDKAIPDDLYRFGESIPWFKRLWVVQEVVLAKDNVLVYAKYNLSLRNIIKAKEDIDKLQSIQPKAIEISVRTLITMHQRAMKRTSLIEFMEEARYARTSNQHDNVYALYGLLSDRGLTLPRPNYAKAVADVYREVAVCLLEAEPDNFRLLLGQAGLPSTITDLASWVPDWSHNKHAHRGGAMEQLYCGASNGANALVRFEDDGKTFVLQGITCDFVNDRATMSLIVADERYGPGTLEWHFNEQQPFEFWTWMERQASKSKTEALRLWNIKVLQCLLEFATDAWDNMTDHDLNTLDRVLYGSCWNLRHLLDDQPSLRRLYDIIRHQSGGSSASNMPRTTAELSLLTRVQSQEAVVLEGIGNDQGAHRHYELITGNAHYHTMFRTAAGHLGLALHTVRKGDHVAVVAGCHQPLILRPQGDGFTFIGVGYIPEIMDGRCWTDETRPIKLR